MVGALALVALERILIQPQAEEGWPTSVLAELESFDPPESANQTSISIDSGILSRVGFTAPDRALPSLLSRQCHRGHPFHKTGVAPCPFRGLHPIPFHGATAILSPSEEPIGPPRERRNGEGRPTMQYNPRILIVDDEPSVSDSLRATFERRSYEVAVATTRAEAEQSVADRKPDAVLLGTIEPRGDAFQLHNWLRETPEYSHVPMIVIDAPEETHLFRGWRRDEGVRMRSEERRVGKECRSRWSPYH